MRSDNERRPIVPLTSTTFLFPNARKNLQERLSPRVFHENLLLSAFLQQGSTCAIICVEPLIVNGMRPWTGLFKPWGQDIRRVTEGKIQGGTGAKRKSQGSPWANRRDTLKPSSASCVQKSPIVCSVKGNSNGVSRGGSSNLMARLNCKLVYGRELLLSGDGSDKRPASAIWSNSIAFAFVIGLWNTLLP